MNLDWKDFNIGLVVETDKGEGFVLSIDKPKNSIGVKIIKGKLETFSINEIRLPFGSMSISLTQQIGQYILLFQRTENRLRDFVNFILSLNSVQKKALTASYTAGKLIDNVSTLIKQHGSELNKTKWKLIIPKLKNHNTIRNTIVHGYLFHYNKNYALDFNNIRITNANGKIESLNFEKLFELNIDVTKLYYEVHNFFSLNSTLIKEKIKTAGNST